MLTRELDGGRGTLNFIMLNPSTADAVRDDPTIRRCVSFARAWGYRRLTVTNLFAFRTPSPRALRCATDPIGPQNDAYLMRTVKDADRTICAWGAHGAHRNREAEVLALLMQHPLEYLGPTKHGHPRHPLYVAGDTVPACYVNLAPQLAAA